MAKKEAAAEQPHDDRCENCGACKHCGAGGRPQFVPYWPYPYPWTVQPYRPYVQPQPYRWTAGGTSPNAISGGTFQQTWNTASGNYQ